MTAQYDAILHDLDAGRNGCDGNLQATVAHLIRDHGSARRTRRTGARTSWRRWRC